jgi:hypothetical protein
MSLRAHQPAPAAKCRRAINMPADQATLGRSPHDRGLDRDATSCT